jgi:hypothetical protein
MDSPLEKAALVTGVAVRHTLPGAGVESIPDRVAAISARVAASAGNFTEFVIFVAPFALDDCVRFTDLGGRLGL